MISDKKIPLSQSAHVRAGKYKSVQCICIAPATATGVTPGETYDVFSSYDHYVQVLNNSQNLVQLPAKWFKFIDQSTSVTETYDVHTVLDDPEPNYKEMFFRALEMLEYAHQTSEQHYDYKHVQRVIDELNSKI